MRVIDEIKAKFKMQGGLVADKLAQKVEKCKAKSHVDHCPQCIDYEVCPIKKWKR